VSDNLVVATVPYRINLKTTIDNSGAKTHHM